MKKTKFLTYLLIAISTFISCKNEISEELETDYKVIELFYGFDNYINNIRDNDLNPIKIKERNLVQLFFDKDGECLINDKVTEVNSLIPELKKYLVANPENDEMPITIEVKFKYAGAVTVNKNLMVLASFDNDLNYKEYNKIRNKIYQAYNEVRNDFAIKKFGKNLAELFVSDNEVENEQFYELNEIFPFNYTEMIEE